MKIVKIFLFVCLLILLATTDVLGYNSTGDIQEWEEAVYGPEQEYNLQSHVNETFKNLANSGAEALLGPANPDYRVSADAGAVNGLGKLIAGMYTHPPASSKEYLADLGSKLTLVKPAYAQGIGFEGLRSILPLWKKFRDITYVFFIIIFVIIGFAIMFRVRLNPQTVVSVQNALPKLIISLLLVTFSYAIAGLLIDLLYVAISLILALLNYPLDVNQNIFLAAGGAFLGIGGFGGAVGTAASQIEHLVESIFTGFGGEILGISANAIARLVFAIALAIALFRVFFTLLLSYISIILGVIFGPFLLMLGALPGQRGLSSWLKIMLSNIVPFPVTAGIFAIAALLRESVGNKPEATWLPPFLGSGTGAYIPALIGVGIVLLAPQIIDSVKKAIGAPGLEGVGTALAPGIAPAAAGARWGAQYRAQVVEEKAEERRRAGPPAKPHEHAERAFWNVLKTTGKIK